MLGSSKPIIVQSASHDGKLFAVVGPFRALRDQIQRPFVLLFNLPYIKPFTLDLSRISGFVAASGDPRGHFFGES